MRATKPEAIGAVAFDGCETTGPLAAPQVREPPPDWVWGLAHIIVGITGLAALAQQHPVAANLARWFSWGSAQFVRAVENERATAQPYRG